MLNPSCNLEAGLKGFPNLGDPPFDVVARDLAIAELRTAGFPRGSETWTTQEIEVFVTGSEADKLSHMGIWVPGKKAPMEWRTVHSVEARLFGWTFTRAWYYWICETTRRPVPQDEACVFNTTWKQQVRAGGYAGGRDVLEDIDSYHVDTPAGLAALVNMLWRLAEKGDTNA